MRNPQGMLIYSPLTPEGQRFLDGQKLTLDQLHSAIAKFAIKENQRVATPIGVNTLGFFYCNELGWHPENPDAFDKPIHCVPWVQIHELLGTVPDGTTGDFLNTNMKTH